MSRSLLPSCSLLALAASTAAHASLWSTVLDPSQMPSAQGWQYYSLNSGLTTEGQVFSTSGGVLTCNTIGNGYQSQGGNSVLRSATEGSFTAGQDWRIEARVRVLQGELWSFHYGFYLGAEFDGMTASVGIMPGTWQDSSLNGWTRDNTQWTTWRLETDRAAGVFRLYADDLLLAVRALNFAASSPGFPAHYVAFGDGTGGANALAEIGSFSFTQIPIPGPGGIAVLALAGMATRARIRRS